MVTRRKFLQTTLAASTLSMVSSPLLSAAESGPSITLYKVIFDERFPDSVAFADAMKRHGVPGHGIRGDMTAVWYDDLYYRWGKAPLPVAGLTAHGPLFCLERLAWDAGMRVVFRAEHRPAMNGRVEHTLSAPDSLLSRALLDLDDTVTDWRGRIADLMVNCPTGSPPALATGIAVPLGGTRAPRLEETLFSWIIAPTGRGKYS